MADVGALVPHGALRGYVMGERAADGNLATADDVASMAAITSIEEIPEAPPMSDSSPEGALMEGTVKFYNHARGFGFVIPDDGSRDGTFERLVELSAADPRLRVLKLRRRFGKAEALRVGIGPPAPSIEPATAEKMIPVT